LLVNDDDDDDDDDDDGHTIVIGDNIYDLE